MKNKIKIGIVLLILLSTNIVHANIVHANSGIVEANYNYANIIINNNQEDVNNLLYEGRVYVPLRYISETFGKFVDWEQDTRTVIIEELPQEDYQGMYNLVEEVETENDINNIKLEIDSELTNLEAQIRELQQQVTKLKYIEETVDNIDLQAREVEKKKGILENLVILPVTPYNETEAQKMIDRITNVDYLILDKLEQTGSRINITNSRITEIPRYSDLKGVVPRGWEGIASWDTIPGLAEYGYMVARIGYSDPGSSHGAVNLELHELGHVVDFTACNNISLSSEFTDIWNKEKRTMFDKYYLTDYSEEYFAETFAYYYLSDNHRNILKRKAPLTYQFMDTLETKIAR